MLFHHWSPRSLTLSLSLPYSLYKYAHTKYSLSLFVSFIWRFISLTVYQYDVQYSFILPFLTHNRTESQQTTKTQGKRTASLPCTTPECVPTTAHALRYFNLPHILSFYTLCVSETDSLLILFHVLKLLNISTLLSS